MSVYQELLRCGESFEYFVENYVRLPAAAEIREFSLHPYQKRFIQHIEQHPYTIATKFRNGGFSTILALYGWWRAAFYQHQSIYFALPTEGQAKHVSSHVERIVDLLPEWLAPKMRKDTVIHKEFAVTGSVLTFGSMVAAKRRCFTHLFIDEAAFVKKMREHWRAAYPTLGAGAKVVVISTTNGLGNWFSEMYSDAAAGRNAIKVFEVSYKEQPYYHDPAIVEGLRQKLGEAQFLQEVEGKFVSDNELISPAERTLPELICDLRQLSLKRGLSKADRLTIGEAVLRLEAGLISKD